MTHPRNFLAAFALTFGIATVAYGQGAQYTSPGALGVAPENQRAGMQNAVDQARWHLGPLRLDPWVSLHDVTAIKSEGEETDITAGVGAGLRGYIPFGSKSVFAVHVLPSYIWHLEQSDQNRLAGRYGLGLFHSANRFSIDLTATASDQDAFVSSEVNRRAEVDNIVYGARSEIPISVRLGLFVNATRDDYSSTDPDPDTVNLSDLSRVTDWIVGGVRWQVASSLRLSFGAGIIETEFDPTAPNRSNEGEFYSVGLDWNRNKTGASLDVRKGELRPTPGSSFTEFDSSTWRGQLFWTPSPRFSLAFYGQSALSYSANPDQGTYLDQRGGIRLSSLLGSSLTGSAYYETGQNRYQVDDHTVDVSSWGASLGLPLGKRFRVHVSARSTSYADTQGVKSHYTELGGGASFSIGSTSSAWY